jgi:hypothetical protein
MLSENKFQEGMTWNNYFHSDWALGRIRPLSSFDLTDDEQLSKACHYINIQPMWLKENYRKGNRAIENNKNIS